MRRLSKPLTILVDMDVICFRASMAGEVTTIWQEEYTDEQGITNEAIVTTELSFAKARGYLDSTMKSIVATVLDHCNPTEHKVLCCLSSPVNFRKALYAEYKANRTKPKPVLYKQVRRYAEQNYDCLCYQGIEADDTIGIVATSVESPVVCSIDKDFLTLPNIVFHNIDKGTFTKTTEESALYAHYFQTLIGDTVDNVKGCVGIGKVKASKVLDQDCSWESVVKTYESKGQTEEDALLNARLVKILTKELWNHSTSEVILWNPRQQGGMNNGI